MRESTKIFHSPWAPLVPAEVSPCDARACRSFCRSRNKSTLSKIHCEEWELCQKLPAISSTNVTMQVVSLSATNKYRKVTLQVSLVLPLLLLLLHLLLLLLLLLLNHAALSQSVEVLEVLLGRVHGAVVVIHARFEHGRDLVGEAAAEEALHKLRNEAPAALQDVARQVLDLDENPLQ